MPDEEEKNEEEEGESPPEQPTQEAKPINSIDKANEAIERMEAANKKTEELLERQESLRASEILSGKADAGQIPEKSVEETDKEYNDRILRGDLNEKEKAEFYS